MGIKIKALPATIYVKIEKDDNADWLDASQYPEGHADIGVRTHIGIYKLHECRTIEGVVESKLTKRARRS